MLLVAVSSCNTAPSHRKASIEVDRRTSLIDQPIHVRVVGLAADEKVTVEAGTVDARGKRFTSEATFKADADGAVDLASDAPLSGTYTGAHGMGLIWSLQPPGSDADSNYFDDVPWSGQVVHLRVLAGGDVVARAEFRRQTIARGVKRRRLRVRGAGFYGEMFYPPPGARRTPGPALLMFGGSEGGLPSPPTAGALASEGYPTLALAYFKEPGLPRSLSKIPLEYFRRALQWLAGQPGVDPRRLAVEGWSRGSEAAMLLGIHYPVLVHGVIAAVPGHVVGCSWPLGRGSAWMLHGRELPCSADPGVATAATPKVVIPVERIHGPILFECGGADMVWPSCELARADMRRLDRHGFAYSHVLLAYPDAGHGIITVPYLPWQSFELQGASRQADPLARAAAWPRLLGFLRGL